MYRMAGAASELWRRCFPQQTAEQIAVWHDLERHYAEPHRHYHTMAHIDALAAGLLERTPNVAHPALAFALIFHDAIYDTKANDNEERSATLAQHALSRLGVDAATCQTVGKLILCTKRHEELPNGDPDWALAWELLDLDLMILGAPAEQYQEYVRNIRREYEWVPEKLFATERARVLWRFLGRRRLFFMEKFRKRFGDQAETNIARELCELPIEELFPLEKAFVISEIGELPGGATLRSPAKCGWQPKVHQVVILKHRGGRTSKCFLRWYARSFSTGGGQYITQSTDLSVGSQVWRIRIDGQ